MKRSFTLHHFPKCAESPFYFLTLIQVRGASSNHQIRSYIKGTGNKRACVTVKTL